MNFEQAVKLVREIYNIPFEFKSEQLDIIKSDLGVQANGGTLA